MWTPPAPVAGHVCAGDDESDDGDDMTPILRLGPIRGCYDGLVVLTTLTRASVPRPLLTRLPTPQLASDLVTGLSVLFMQEDTELGQVGPTP